MAAFFRQLPKAEKHDRISPTELPLFPRAVRWGAERGALLCLIFARLEGKPLVEISTFLIDPKYLDYPHFLGRPAESFAVLSNVELD